ncbi:filamentous hemagglutinin N-terminal domain-containing protein [Paraburkholderia sprentiae WSM5005]|uniref:Filamentous hemagglutinin N-terminal domain-containing protein n=1 Tax=Paraburkholderia sprentiae WSM5005 TaxID=754502 RepID=A0A1I9YLN0_9BURK|nr:filamentous hemagglutinin N-terminal domain-containing protein [Paraburkholderia sprentiae]APA87213.1 filamentous hemagglutinin N-terminal domain-containing protein [Paraburkholderia sprentiae WSM5005]
MSLNMFSMRPPRGARKLPAVSIVVSLLGLSCAAPVFAAGTLPQGGAYVSGNGSIAGAGNTLTVTQPGSTRGVINWNSFSIGRNNTVVFNNGSGATLNRVTGGSPSAILGKLNATGSVYLINPQGVVVGQQGVVSTGGRFVASTLDTDNASFMNGGALTFSGQSEQRVVNLGRIGSTNGDVLLIAAKEVDNYGSIRAPQGTAEVAVGNKVLLQDSSSSQQMFVQTASGGAIVNTGVIEAAQVSLQAVDGNIYALAGCDDVVRATGTATRGGHVWLVAGTAGQVILAGNVGAQNADGTGGTVDTSTGLLTFWGDLTKVTTGQWNITLPAYTFDNGAARTFARSLNASTSIGMTTTGASGQSGDIGVEHSIQWTGDSSLTLNAAHGVSVASGVTLSNQGGGALTLRADAGSINNGGSVTNSGTIDWSSSTGIVSALYDISGSYTPGTVLSNSAWRPPAYSGLVTQITGYKLVNSVQDLQNIVEEMGGNYALGKDIDASDYAFRTLGFATNASFSGQFNGMWHTVSNISPDANAVFSDIAANGVVRDVNVNANSHIYAPSFRSVGILAGTNHGLIVNTFTSGAIRPPSNDSGATIGGLVGSNYGTIARSGSSANVTADSCGGGLVYSNTGTITQSYATGDVSSNESRGSSAGLVHSNTGTVTQSFATGKVSAFNVALDGAVCYYCSGLGSDVYWNVDTTGLTTSGGNLPPSNGLTTAQMSNPASFAGWDFGTGGAWALPAGTTHPVLRWQIEH